jgi:hypothetical protein
MKNISQKHLQVRNFNYLRSILGSMRVVYRGRGTKQYLENTEYYNIFLNCPFVNMVIRESRKTDHFYWKLNEDIQT